MTQQKQPTGASVRAIVDLLVDVERRLSAGPWDEWDGDVLLEWQTIVRDRLNQALHNIDRQLSQQSGTPGSVGQPKESTL